MGQPLGNGVLAPKQRAGCTAKIRVTARSAATRLGFEAAPDWGRICLTRQRTTNKWIKGE